MSTAREQRLINRNNKKAGLTLKPIKLSHCKCNKCGYITLYLYDDEDECFVCKASRKKSGVPVSISYGEDGDNDSIVSNASRGSYEPTFPSYLPKGPGFSPRFMRSYLGKKK